MKCIPVALALLLTLVGCAKKPDEATPLEPPAPTFTIGVKQCIEGVYYFGLWHDYGKTFVPQTPAYNTESKVQTCTSDK